MRNKIYKTFALIIFSFILTGGFLFSNYVYGATILTDDFNSYSNGSIEGQGGWTGNGVNEFFTVQSSTVKEGTKAIESSLNFPFVGLGVTKIGDLLSDGSVSVSVRRNATFTNGLFRLWEGNSIKVIVQFSSSSGNQGSIVYQDNGGIFRHLSLMAPDTWYQLQIEWRSSPSQQLRYRVDEGMWTDWVVPRVNWTVGLNTINLFRGSVTGSGRIYFDDIREKLIPNKTPVLIVPGIVGTELWNGDEHIWANLERMFLDVGDQFLTENLSLDENGNSIQNILTKKVIEKIARSPFDVNIFQNLRSSLELSRYELDKDLFFFPYDWRFDLNNTKDVLKQKIDEIKLQTGSPKVDIISHSMGGLLVKTYVKEYGKDSIDKLIFVGTPHIGVPKSGKVILEGDNFNIPWLRQERVEEMALNMPSLHQLLPNQTYFNQFQGYIKPFDFLGNEPLYDYSHTKDFFINDKNKNQIMFNKAEDFFDKNLDNLDLSDIDAYNIAGCKPGTQAAYRMSILGNIGLISYTSGDGTVPLISSDYINITQDNKYYVKNGGHSELPSTVGVRELILNILNEEEPTLAENVSNNSNFCGFIGKTLIWRSPVEVHIYDQFNNHTGPTENNGIEYGILGVDYEVIDGEKFIFLPTNEGQEYTIKGIGEDNGTFDLLISKIDNGDVLNSSIYNDIVIAPNSQIDFNISENSSDNVIEYDFENSGNFLEIEANSFLNGEQGLDLVPPKTKIILTGKEHKDGSFKSDVLVHIESTDNLSGVLETWYSLDGEFFKRYANPFILEKKGVYKIYYYSVDRAGNNEDISVLEVKVGIKQKQFDRCWQENKCDKIIKTGKDSGVKIKNIKKIF